ncbi:S-adenosyl-L-methionine-dependent methyltransferase [Aspergillus coremiiformis]|uniref:S-adenosyl-L-methionine-dependent methyltransferase n=1 Tax=Aspergillus coremiiformis TaxID=138285 RepID=A0A5N6Z5L5_9EURO|nr:S-adenosyl-L-methionine-dependent methyltransferase [Aspergillus coremiiformis]
MRVCVLQSAYTSPHPTEDYPAQDPGKFTDQHTFDHVWIHKKTAKEQIDETIAKNYDFYFNFMWGQHEDDLAGIDACKYFESFGLPSIGQRSEVLERSKNDFYKTARALGRPRVPGTSKYPLFVKAATSCASQFIYDWSLCRNRDELIDGLAKLKEALASGRAIAGRSDEASPTAPVVDGIPIPDDIVVQEYIRGWDHSVVVIEVGGVPVPLAPERYVYPKGFKPYDEFLTLDMKFHKETNVELLRYADDPVLFSQLQELAIEAWHTNNMTGQSWGNVDIRVPAPGAGEPTVLEVNPMPAVFLPPSHEFEDIAIRECFPGGNRALVNTLIANYFVLNHTRDQDQKRVADVYDVVSDKYDENIAKVTRLHELYEEVLAQVDLHQGTILDLGAGTGLFGRALTQKMQLTPPSECDSILTPSSLPSRPFSLTAIELSSGMVDKCRQTGVYDIVHHGSMQNVLPTIGPFDHIVSLSALYFLPPVDFCLVMVRSFQLARKSLVVCVDEPPESYIAKLVEMGPPHSYMVGYNHVEEMEKTFCTPPPPGWTLTERFQRSAWNSPVTGTEVYATVYCFERKG